MKSMFSHASQLCFVGAILFACSGCKKSPSIDPKLRESDQPAELVFEPERINLGRMLVGTSKAFASKLHNKGDAILKVIAVESNCGCAQVSLDKMTLFPGEEAQLTGVFRASSEPGDSRKAIVVKLEGRVKPLILEIVATFHRVIDITSSTVVLSPDLYERKPVREAVVVHNTSDATVVLKTGALPNGLQMEIPNPSVGPNEKTEVVFVADCCFLTNLRGEALLYTSHPFESSIPIKYCISPRNGLICAPDAVRLGVLSKKDFLAKKDIEITIQGKVLQELIINDISAPRYLRLLEKRLSPTNDKLTIRFDFVVPLSGSILEGDIELSLTRKGSSDPWVLRIPVSGVILDAQS